MIQVAFECIGQDSWVTRNRNSLWNSWSKVRIGWRFVTLQEDQGWISASWIYPPRFFFPHMVKTLSLAPVLPISPSKLDWETRTKQQTKHHTFTHTSLCTKSMHACGVGGACVSVCICLSFAHPSRMHSKQAILDASREQVQGENLFPLLDLRKSVKDGPQVTAQPSLLCAGTSCFIDLLIPLYLQFPFPPLPAIPGC